MLTYNDHALDLLSESPYVATPGTRQNAAAEMDNDLEHEPLSDFKKIQDVTVRGKSYTVLEKSEGGSKVYVLGVITGDKVKIALEMITDPIEIPGEYDVIQVSSILLDKAFKGRGLAPFLYTYMVKSMGFVIVSDGIQLTGGMILWKKLAKIKGLQLDLYDPKAKKITEVDVNGKEYNYAKIWGQSRLNANTLLVLRDR